MSARASGVSEPWFVSGLDFDEAGRRLTIRLDFRRGARFGHPDEDGAHPVHDTQTKRYRHLNFFEHECLLEARVPRARLPDDRVALAKPPWAGKLAGFTLLFEALILAMCREMPFAAVARLTGASWHRVRAICARYVELTLELDDLSGLRHVGIDETSRAKGHNYVTAVADTEGRCLCSWPKAASPAPSRSLPTTYKHAAVIRARSTEPPSTCRPPSSRALRSICPTPN